MLVGFVLQAGALGNGPISFVQPMLVLELPFTLLLASRVLGGRVSVREWSAIGCMAGGLALLLYGLAPHGGDPSAVSLLVWLSGLAVTVSSSGC